MAAQLATLRVFTIVAVNSRLIIGGILLSLLAYLVSAILLLIAMRTTEPLISTRRTELLTGTNVAATIVQVAIVLDLVIETIIALRP